MALPATGWDVTILSGSLSRPDLPGDARAFYRDLDLHAVDFTRAPRGAGPACSPIRRSIPPSRTGPARRTACSPRCGRGRRAPRRRLGERADRCRSGCGRRAAPAPPDTAQRGGGAGRAGVPVSPPARHRAADARGDRARVRPSEEHGERGRADAPLAAACARSLLCSPTPRSPSAEGRAGHRCEPLRAGPHASTPSCPAAEDRSWRRTGGRQSRRWRLRGHRAALCRALHAVNACRC